MSNKKQTKGDIAKKLKELEAIAAWFEGQEELDLEEGMVQVKKGAVLVKELRERLKKVENEFREVKKTLDTQEEE